MEHLTDEQVREAVKERYAASARLALQEKATSCCGGVEPSAMSCCGDAAPEATSCCGGAAPAATSCCSSASEAPVTEASSCCGEASKTRPIDPISSGLYDEADTPFDSALAASLGCGNPTALAELVPGEDVLDLGSGGGLDVLLSARRVGPTGTAYGLDMTEEMLALAQKHQAEAGIENARFMLGTIEQVPMPDASVDVVISNCVINLSPDKAQVFHDAFRVLKPGGRLAISDVVATAELPEAMRQDAALIAGCMGNASLIGDLEAMMRAAGFAQIRIEPKDESKAFIADWAPGRNVTDYVVAATIEAVKPGACCGGSRC